MNAYTDTYIWKHAYEIKCEIMDVSWQFFKIFRTAFFTNICKLEVFK